jgi:tRNA G18 (ribose-2'-O)-methylase SpoU
VPIIRIDDSADARLADYRAVAEPRLAAAHGMFIAEGRLVVGRLLGSARFATRSVLVTEPAMTALADALARRPEVPVFLVSQPAMNAIAGFNIHRGCLAIGERPAAARWQDLAAQFPTSNSQLPKDQTSRMLVCLERVANPDNVGGVFRSASAFGAGGVLLDPVTTDPFYRKAIRTSMGAVLQVPFARVDSWPGALMELSSRGFAVIAMTPSTSATPVRNVAQAIGRRPAVILFGHEGEGLTADALAACELHARISISSNVDSLNVATAAGIALYEFSQRC